MSRNSIAQTFSLTGSSQGQFITKVGLYFQDKDPVHPVTLEIREVEAGIITDRMLPFSRVTVESADIATSPTGLVGTPFIFETPVFVSGSTEYAIVLYASGNASRVRLFTASIGEDDLNTNQKIVEQPHTGILHLSSNDTTFSAEQDSDLRFEIWGARFLNNSGSFVVRTAPMELMTVSNVSSVIVPDEYVVGETRLVVANTANGTFTVGALITGATSAANGIITNVSGSNLRVRLNGNNVSQNFGINEVLSANTGPTARVSSFTVPTGKVLNYNGSTSLQLYDVSNTVFDNGEILRTATGKTATVTSIGGTVPYDMNFAGIEDINFGLTSTDYSAKYTTTGFQRNGNYEPFVKRTNVEHVQRKFIHSFSTEVANMSSVPSYEFLGRLSSQTNYISPIYDKDRSNFVSVDNKINNDSTNETLANHGNAIARYTTRVATLEEGQDAEDIQVILTAHKPYQTDVKVYARLLHGEDADLFTNRVWIEMPKTVPTANLFSSEENDLDFKELRFELPASVKNVNRIFNYTNSKGVLFTGYKYFSIKIVMLSSNESIVPRIKELRTIALQV